MKFNKQIIMVMVLISLLISALGVAYYFYLKGIKISKVNEQLVTLYVASSDIKKNTKIAKEHLKEIKLEKKYILAEPMLQKELIGKFVKENIYKDEQFRKEKVVADLNLINYNDDVIAPFRSNSYNMKFSLFKNPNYSIDKGDTINIISVYTTNETKANGSSYSVQYVASGIKVLGFLMNGKETDKTIEKVKEIQKVKKENKEVEIEKKADEIILDIDNQVLIRLIEDFNRGTQLWMVKTHGKEETANILPQSEELFSKKQPIQLTTVSKKTFVAKSKYPIKLYIPEEGNYATLSATIHYGDQKEGIVIEKESKNKINAKEVCENTKEYLLGISDSVHLRKGAGKDFKIIKTITRNYLIPYQQKVNGTWYRTCDGYFIHEDEVKPLSQNILKMKLREIQ
jgi:hypothetical protein